MLFTTVAALLFPVAIMAVPAQKPAQGDDECSPVSYIMSEYTLTRSPSYAFVSFNVQSTFTVDSRSDDAVTAGANCEADGVDIPKNDNKCNIAIQKTDNLTFDLMEGSGVPSYRIHHQWKCNNATWVSTNDIKLPPLKCDAIEDGKNGDSVRCTSKPFIFTPQSTRKLSVDDDKKAAGKANVVKPTAAGATPCPKCTRSHLPPSA